MGDGTKSGTGLSLQTQSFTFTSILMYKFNLNCSIHMQRNKPTIFIHSKSIKQIKPKLLSFFLFLGDIKISVSFFF